MKNYYIEDLEKIESLVAERKSKQLDIIRAIDAWVEDDYGIKNFSKMTDEYLNNSSSITRFGLWRQIPSVRVEDIGCYIGSKILGYEIVSLSYLDDSFSSNNHEKRSYVDTIWTGHGRKNKLYVYGKKILDCSMPNEVNRPLSKIKVRSGSDSVYLHDYHFDLRKKVFGTNNVIDVSNLRSNYARMASKPPTSIFVINDQGRYKRVDSALFDLKKIDFRPSADWYYPLYFACFLTGKMIMLETYDNPLAEVSEAKKLFEATMDLVEDNVGYRPLVLKIPPLDQKTLSIPKKLIEKPAIIDDILSKINPSTSGDSLIFFSTIYNEILERS